VPLVLGTLGRTRDLTDAMHARCYRGGDGRTRRQSVTVTRADVLALAATIAITALVVVLRYTVNPF
jgi:energy-coupling factor transport system permease protein